MRLLNEIKQDKNKIISEHTKYLTTIKNKDINSVDNIVLEHIKKSADSCKKKYSMKKEDYFLNNIKFVYIYAIFLSVLVNK